MLRFAVLLPWAAAVLGADIASLTGNLYAPVLTRDGTGNLYIVAIKDVGNEKVAVVKLDPTARQVLWARTVGGSGRDTPAGLAVTPDGSAFVIGATRSADFPTTEGALLRDPGGRLENGFLVRLNADGSIAYSTLLPGSPAGITVNRAGEAYVTGAGGAESFPPNPTLSASTVDSYIIKVDGAGSRLLLSVRGAGGARIALDAAGDIYVAGATVDPNYPITPGAFERTYTRTVCGFSFGGRDVECPHGLVSRVDSAGKTLVYSTFLSAEGGESPGIFLVDASGQAHLAINRRQDACLAKLSPDGSNLTFATCLPGASATGATDPNKNLYLAGTTTSADFPGRPPIHEACLPDPSRPQSPQRHGFITRLSLDGATVISTRLIPGAQVNLSGLAIDAQGVAWVSGNSNSLADIPFARVLDAFPGAPAHTQAFIAGVDFAEPLPARRVDCVKDPADYSFAGPVAPGQLLTLFGTGLGPEVGVQTRPDRTAKLPTSVAGLSVTFDDQPATLLYVSSGQVNTAVPFATRPGDRTRLRVEMDGALLDERLLDVVERIPRAFVHGGYVKECELVTGQLAPMRSAAVNPEGTLNTCDNPARPGSVVAVFLNGLGVTDTILPDGSLNPVPPAPLGLAVELAEAFTTHGLEIDFAGAAALQVTGVWQVNLRVPEPSPPNVALLLRAGGTLMMGSVVIWVRP